MATSRLNRTTTTRSHSSATNTSAKRRRTSAEHAFTGRHEKRARSTPSPASSLDLQILSHASHRTLEQLACNIDAPPFWLDLLPYDICMEVARILVREFDETVSDRMKGVLNLTRLSEKYRLAVAEARGNKLVVTTSDRHKWCPVFQDNVQSLHLGRGSWKGRTLKENAPLLCVLKSQTIETLCIESRKHYIRVATLLPNLLNLTIEVTTSCTADLFISLLRKTKLETLRIACSPNKVRKCMFVDFLPSTDIWDQVAHAVPKLKYLEIYRCEGEGEHEKLFPHLNQFSSIRKFTTNCQVPQREVPFLRSLEQVCFYNYWKSSCIMSGIPYSFLADIGAPVREVYCMDCCSRNNWLTEDKAMLLTRDCPRLEKFHGTVGEGGELPILKLERLTHLSLSFAGAIPGIGISYRSHPNFYLTALDVAPRLKALRLTELFMSLPYLQALLSRASQLEEFETSVHNQADSPLERVAALLRILGEYNSTLRRLRFNPIGRNYMLVHMKSLGTALREMKTNFSVLCRKAPQLDSTELRAYIRAIVTWSMGVPVYSNIRWEERVWAKTWFW